MVLEKGYDFMPQIDGAIEFALQYSLLLNGGNGTRAKAQTQTQAHTLIQERISKIKVDDYHKAIYDHSLHHEDDEKEKGVTLPSWVQHMNEQMKMKMGGSSLSAKGACCLAKTIREDYDLLMPTPIITKTNSENANNATANNATANNATATTTPTTTTTPLAEIVCNGPAAHLCREALNSIANRLLQYYFVTKNNARKSGRTTVPHKFTIML